MLFVLKELETGALGQAFQCVLSHGFAHPQQPKSQFYWKIRGPGIVWTRGSSRNLPCPEADAVSGRRRALNLSGATGSEFNQGYSFWDDFMHCLVGHTARNGAMFLILNLCFTGNSCFGGIAATASVVPAHGCTDFLGHPPNSSLLQACTHCSMTHAACYCLLFSCFCWLFCLNVHWIAILCSYQCTSPSRKNIYYCLSSLPDFESLSYPLFALLLFSGAQFPSSCCIHFADPSCCSHRFYFPTLLHQASWQQRLLISAPISGRGSCFFGCAACCFSSIGFGGVYPSVLRLKLPQQLCLTVAQIVAGRTALVWLLDSWSRPTPEHSLRLFCCNAGLPILIALSTVRHPTRHCCHGLQETTSLVKKCCSSRP